MLTPLIFAMAASTPAALLDPCQSLRSQDDVLRAGEAPGATRLVSSWDIATLTDIGRGDPSPSPPPFSISPDGTTLAVMLRRGDPRTNRYCLRLVTLPVEGKEAPKELERGGDFIRATFSYRGLAALPAGYEKVIAPSWSPDGKQIAFLREDDGPPQVWLVGTNGENPHPATASQDKIEAFAWTPQGDGFIIATRPGLRRAEKNFAIESATGYEYDARFVPLVDNEPHALEPIPTVYSRVDIATGSTRTATPQEAALLEPSKAGTWQKGWRQVAISAKGYRAVTLTLDPDALAAPSQLRIEWGKGYQILCDPKVCGKPSKLWWSRDGATLTFQTRVGWKDSQSALYQWQAGKSHPKPLLVTQDFITGCVQNRDTLICTRDGALSPRRIISIDLASGRARTIFNPNPAFDQLRLGPALRLNFVNALGIQGYADLVLPPDHKPGQKHPLVFVQYSTDGFLRGGTGDEEPIQALASRGFAVLSYEHYGLLPPSDKAHSERELRVIDNTDLIGRRVTEANIEMAVAKAVETGTIDTDRMGISGMSEGASATQWALIHSSLFKVASMGVCCEEQVAQPLAGGPGYAQYLREMGYPPFDQIENSYWPQLSLVRNIDHIDVPILVQTGGNEYQTALYTAQAFRDRGKAFDFYILPDETHVKWQPAHRLAMYERNVDWFSFWFLHQRDCSPDKAPQYARWLAMRGAPKEGELSCWKAPSPQP